MKKSITTPGSRVQQDESLSNHNNNAAGNLLTDDPQVQKTYFNILFNSAPEAIALHDNNDCISDVNDEFVRLFGYSREECLGRPINQLIVPVELKHEGEHLSKSVLKGHIVELDTRRKRKDGSLVSVSVLGAPIFHNGTQIGDFAIYRDITARKKIEEDLLLQKIFYKQLFTNAAEAIVLHDTNDIIVDVNEDFIRMFGYSREECIGKKINSLVAPREYMDNAEKLSGLVTHGRRVEEESKRRRKDGTVFDVSILGAPIFSGNRQVGIYAIYRDISGHVKAREELQIQKTLLEKLFNTAPEAIVLQDNNDIITDVNDEFVHLFGYSKEEAIGRPINDIVANKEQRKEAERLSGVVISGRKVETDSVRTRKDGTLFDAWIIGAPIMHKGRQVAVYVIYRDITERKKAKENRIRRSEEARMARNIQTNLLPKTKPVLPGYDISGRSIPALNVGGDYFDFIRLDSHRLAVCLGDVSGKGLGAALVMSNLQATIRSQAIYGNGVHECLEKANTLLYKSVDKKTFVSLFYGILDIRDSSFTYVNAGHNPPVLFHTDGTVTVLNKHGIALGFQEQVSYTQKKIILQGNDVLVIYSDGITEAMNSRRIEFGETRLFHTITKNRTLSSDTIINQVIQAVNSHFDSAPQNDDMTIVLIKHK